MANQYFLLRFFFVKGATSVNEANKNNSDLKTVKETTDDSDIRNLPMESIHC